MERESVGGRHKERDLKEREREREREREIEQNLACALA